MQTANVLVALGGDRGNSVPKHVTAPEIMVLLAIHGDDAVYDIEPAEDIERSNTEEINRLRATYFATGEDGKPKIDAVYTGKTPMLHQDLADLELPDDLYKATERAKAPAKSTGKKKAAAKGDDGILD